MSDKFENPFVGPRAFEKGEEKLFYGRETEARTLLAQVISEPLVLFYARSGVGKSSLINTCLIPSLEEEEFVVLPVGRVGGTLTNESDKIDNIFVFNLLTSLAPDDTPLNDLSNMTLSAFLKKEKQTRPSHEGGRVLIIDQFEEIINTNLDYWQHREQFFRQLNEAIQDDDLLWVVLAMREDFVPALDPYTSLMADRMRNRFYMEQMKIGNAIDAIRKPAILGGRPFAPGVAEKLVDDLRLQQSVDPLTTKPILSQFVEPVHLQVVCYQLWQNLKARSLEEITLQDLDELGNIDTALLQFYEQSIARVLQEFKISELELRNWFEQKLITESSTRGTVYEGPTETAGLSNEITHFLINQFILRSETRAGGRWYELVHDRFVGPIQQANKTWWEGQIPLVKTANLWNQSGQPPTLLFREQQLREALETFDWEEGEPVVKNFLEACRDRQNQQTLLVANAQIKAEAERTKKAIRETRRSVLSSIVLGVCFIVAMVFIGWAGQQILATNAEITTANLTREFAVDQREMAEAASTRAFAQLSEANATSTQAIAALETAEAAAAMATFSQGNAQATSTAAIATQEMAQVDATIAVENQIAAYATSTRALELKATAEISSTRTTNLRRQLSADSLLVSALDVINENYDTELATLLVLEALTINEEENGNSEDDLNTALLEILTDSNFNVTLTGHSGEISTIAFTSDSRRLASAGANGEIRLWDLAHPSLPSRLLAGHEGSVTQIIFIDDETLISSGQDGTIRTWTLNTSDATSGRITIQVDLPIQSFDISPDNESIIFSLSDGSIYLQALNEPDDVVFCESEGSTGIQPVIFDEIDSTVTVGISNRLEQRWVKEPCNLLDVSPAWQNDSISYLAAYSGGRIYGGINGQARLERLKGYDVNLIGHTDKVNAVTLSPEKNFIASASDDGTVRLWEMPGPTISTISAKTILTAHTGPVQSVAFSPDNRWLASAGADGTIRLWRLTFPFPELTGGPAIAFAPVDPIFAYAHNNSSGSLTGNKVILQSTADWTSPPTILNVETGQIASLAFSPDGNYLLAQLRRGTAGEIRVWSINDPDFPATAKSLLISPPVAAISPDNQWVAFASTLAGRIDLLPIDNLTSGAYFASPRDHRSQVFHLAFSQDGNWLISANGGFGRDNEIRLWPWPIDPSSPQSTVLVPFGAEAIAVSADSDQVARLSVALNDIRLWELGASPTGPHILVNSTGTYKALSFSANGDALVAVGNGIRLWRLDDLASPPRILADATYGYENVAFAPNGQMIAVANEDTVQLWPIILSKELACQQLHRNLTWTEWQQFFGKEQMPYRQTCPHLPPAPDLPESNAQDQPSEVSMRFWQVNLVLWLYFGIATSWRKNRGMVSHE